jgi:hypothetical protein
MTAGFVGYDSKGRFMHYCFCGAWGAFGFNTRRNADPPELGQWYCLEHRHMGDQHGKAGSEGSSDQSTAREASEGHEAQGESGREGDAHQDGAARSLDRWATVLTEAEIRIGIWVGKQRFANAIALDRDPGKGPSRTKDSPDNSIRGVHCEMAGSFILNLSWRPHVGDIHQRDIGGLVEVRSTVLANGRLIVKPPKPNVNDDDVPYGLIKSGEHHRYTLLGWLFAKEARRFELLTEFGDEAHFAPQSALRTNESLVEWIRKQR